MSNSMEIQYSDTDIDFGGRLGQYWALCECLAELLLERSEATERLLAIRTNFLAVSGSKRIFKESDFPSEDFEHIRFGWSGGSQGDWLLNSLDSRVDLAQATGSFLRLLLPRNILATSLMLREKIAATTDQIDACELMLAEIECQLLEADVQTESQALNKLEFLSYAILDDCPFEGEDLTSSIEQCLDVLTHRLHSVDNLPPDPSPVSEVPLVS